jgi:hypothetical protein
MRRTWFFAKPNYDRTWYAWFLYRSSGTVRMAEYWWTEFLERREEARANRRAAN